MQPLHFAISDAQKMARALIELGGVSDSDLQLDEKLRPDSFAHRLQEISQQMRKSQQAGERVEFLFYYSGHADEEGLRLGDEKLRFRDLRRAIDAVPADLRLIVVDACAAGELTRKKGGQAKAAFLLDQSNAVKGLAIMTSSSAEEASQESDRLGGSFFTHYLINALRGAGDDNSDGIVTLAEAYQYTYDETLQRTQKTQSGPQHPSFDMNLAGAGDVVLSDLRSAAATLVLDENLIGRIYLLDEQGRVQAQIDKSAGRSIKLGIEPGAYAVSLQQNKKMWSADLDLHHSERRVLQMSDFSLTELETTQARGGSDTLSGLRYQDRFFELALWPGAGSNAALGMYRINHLSLTLLGGDGARLDGFALSLLRNRSRLNLRGMQLSLLGLNQVGAQAIGFQFALLGNSVGEDFYGLQLALVNVVMGRMTGLQISPALGLAMHSAYGLQLAGLSNLNLGEMRGAQLAAGFNGAQRVRGLQLSLVNLAEHVDGAQIGLVNIADEVNGLQFGLVNLADKMHGAPLGLVSLARNGSWHGELWSDDMHAVNLGFQLGNPLAYTLFSASLQPEIPALGMRAHWALGLGLGLRLNVDDDWAVDSDLRVLQLWQNDWSIRDIELANSLRIGLRYQLWSRLALKAGLTLNLAINTKLDHQQLTPLPRWQMRDAAPQLSLWPGGFAGLVF